MAPPAYDDIGESANDVLEKGYNAGLLKLDVKTKKSGIDFKTDASYNLETKDVEGNFETKYTWSEYGLIVTEKWSLNNVFTTELGFAEQLKEGLDVSFNHTYTPNTGSHTGGVKTSWMTDYLALNCDVDLNSDGTATVNDSAVLGYNGWLAGYQTAFDFDKSQAKLTKNNFGFGYIGDDFAFTTNVVNDCGDEKGQEFTGSVYRNVNDRVEAALSLSWNSADNSTSLEVGGNYKLGDDATFQAKVNNQARIGLGYTQKLKEGIKLNISSLLDTKNMNAGGLKVGLGLEFEA